MMPRIYIMHCFGPRLASMCFASLSLEDVRTLLPAETLVATSKNVSMFDADAKTVCIRIATTEKAEGK